MYNAALNHVRGSIERMFGRLKRTFRIISANFRHRHDYFNCVFRCCCALYNIQLRAELTYAPDVLDVADFVWRDGIASRGMF